MVTVPIVFLLYFAAMAVAFSQHVSKGASTTFTDIRRPNIMHKVARVANRYPLQTVAANVDSALPSSNITKLPVTKAPHRLSVHQFVYVVLTSIFVTCLIVADVIGVKIFELNLPFKILGHSTIEHTCGMLTFPITFLLGDIINEYYGPKAAKDTIYIGLGMSILVFVVMNLAQALPYLNKPFNGSFHCFSRFFHDLITSYFFPSVTPEAFNMIFGSAKLMYVASIM